MVHILGRHNVIQFGSTKFWPERGQIHWENTENNLYDSMSVRDFTLRVKAVNDSWGGPINAQDDNQRAWLLDRRNEAMVFVQKAIGIIRIAKEQGMPQDQTAQSALVRAQPKTFQVPDLGKLHRFTVPTQVIARSDDG